MTLKLRLLHKNSLNMFMCQQLRGTLDSSVCTCEGLQQVPLFAEVHSVVVTKRSGGVGGGDGKRREDKDGNVKSNNQVK